MDHWNILGIEATTDKRLIKLAYTELLKKTSPTEFPEEFKNLRKAYELATKEAKQAAKNHSKANTLNETEPEIKGVVDESYFDEAEVFAPPVELEIPYEPVKLDSINSISQLQIALNELYSNIVSRNDVEQWKLLFSSPLFWDVDQNKQVSLTLIEFFSEHYFLSDMVFRFLDESMKITSELVVSKDRHCRELAIALRHYISTLPRRINPSVNISDTVSFEKLHQHLMLRNYIEEQFMFNALTAEQLITLMQNVDDEFKNDFALYLYVGNYLWTLSAYEEIQDLLNPLQVKADDSHLRTLQANVAFKLQHYDIALAIYLEQEEANRNFISKMMFKDIGLCYLKLKDYAKAYMYLNAYNSLPEEMELYCALITARRCYIQELKLNEEDNIIKIATLQFENGRYQDALLLTQKYNQTFEKENNYLQALCLGKLNNADEAFSVFSTFIELYQKRQQRLWPLLVDLVLYCSKLITYEFMMETIIKNLPSSTGDFDKIPYYQGSIHQIAYSEYELKYLKITFDSYEPQANTPSSYIDNCDFSYTQFFAWAHIHVLLSKLANFNDPKVVKGLYGSALFGIKQAMQKVTYEPKWAIEFIDIAFNENDYATCIELSNHVINAFSNFSKAYYYKGKSLAALGQHDEAIDLLVQAATKYGNHSSGVYSLEAAIESCDKLVELGQPVHAQYSHLCQQLQTTKEIVDAQ
ncbi:tetratricopeptide repeat protein [Pseudocolwellia sp. HL-MZ19]|uniref:tetratricopeptide repeat protein n=1 Tax=Pseudocolwellia sp. HL-MZ19 TaxID=3400846 RepID=UPI003CE67FDF